LHWHPLDAPQAATLRHLERMNRAFTCAGTCRLICGKTAFTIG
jgi:hypothetical protein